MSLVTHDQILSSFNQAYYCTNYFVLALKNVSIWIEIIVFRDFMSFVQ